MSEKQLKTYRIRQSGGGLPTPADIETVRTRRTAVSRLLAIAAKAERDGAKKVTYWVPDPSGGPRLAHIYIDDRGRVTKEVRKIP